MKKLFLLLFIAIMTSGCVFAQSVDTKEVLKEIAKDSTTVVIDVRTIQEFEEGHIDNSIHIPLSIIKDSIPDYEKNKKIIIVCKGGGRAEKARAILREKGFTSVYNGGGWNAFDKIVKSE